MAPAPSNWWSAKVDGAGPGTDYGFSLDGGRVLPDPRSPWQPHGVHGRSRRVAHDPFPWTDAGWLAPPLSDAVIYELHVGTFSPEGTFDGATARLDHLAALGITHVELMPVSQFPGARGWGYDGVYLYAPHTAYGGPEGLKRFVDAAHARGLAVLLDVVYNHLGPTGNYLASFGPYFTSRYVTPWGQAVNLDGPRSDEVRRFFCDNALMWLRDYHVDGLRIDAIHALLDTSARHFLEELRGDVATLEAHSGRRLVLVAESDLNDPRVVRAPDVGGYGIDAQWSDDFHHALHTVLTGERSGYYEDFGSLADLAKALEDVFVYDGRYSVFRGRRHGRPVGDLPRERFIGFLQNHDQVGNRARGERSSHLLGRGRLEVGAALVLLGPFVPLLFQGEEWGATAPFLYFTDHEDADVARAATEGRRDEFTAFGWAPDQVPDPQEPATFARSRLDWGEPGREPHASLLAWHRRLIALRRAIVRPAERVRGRFDEAARWLALDRPTTSVVCNLGDTTHRVPLPWTSEARVLLSSVPLPTISSGALDLPPDAVAVVAVGSTS
jgi:maltooligosyltrehalose trehalohydrolase